MLLCHRGMEICLLYTGAHAERLHRNMIPLPKVVHARPRLIFTFMLGLVFVFITPGYWGWVSRALIGWNIAVWSYLVLVGWLMSCANHESVRQIAEREDEGAFAVLA